MIHIIDVIGYAYEIIFVHIIYTRISYTHAIHIIGTWHISTCDLLRSDSSILSRDIINMGKPTDLPTFLQSTMHANLSRNPNSRAAPVGDKR